MRRTTYLTSFNFTVSTSSTYPITGISLRKCCEFFNAEMSEQTFVSLLAGAHAQPGLVNELLWRLEWLLTSMLYYDNHAYTRGLVNMMDGINDSLGTSTGCLDDGGAVCVGGEVDVASRVDARVGLVARDC
jgi:hypothetical protein